MKKSLATRERSSLFGWMALNAFTMAEILLSLTIIGVVAAITLPSLTGNINERTWNTQRKALYSRISQAIALMPSLNGYGTTLDNHAETFITSGLAKVIKINNICGPDSLQDCGLPTQITPTLGEKFNIPTDIQSLNNGIIANSSPVSIKNTKAAAFETANGESILTFYNPNCTAENVLITGYAAGSTLAGQYTKQHVCANLIYDLNGKKGPNTVGKDIGAISIIYSSDSKVVMPMYPKTVTGTKSQPNAAKECKNLNEGQYRLPNIEELLSIYYNTTLYGGQDNLFGSSLFLWSATSIDANRAYAIGNARGIRYPYNKGNTFGIVCVER